jgi:LacI family transcriptional regulator
MGKRSNLRNTVQEYAKHHGYNTNVAALELRGEKKKTIAVIVPNINHQFFSNIISSFTNIAASEEYVVSVFQTNENFEQEQKIIDR